METGNVFIVNIHNTPKNSFSIKGKSKRRRDKINS